MEQEGDTGYRWEQEYEKTWEAITEDASGLLRATGDDLLLRARRRQMLSRPTNVRLGMMRHLFVVIDMSQAMENLDLHPTRLKASLKLLENFVEEYFDQNPISQLALVTTRNKRATKITELGGNPKRHVAALRQLSDQVCQGEPSLQNSLELCLQTLAHVPKHASREILVILGSLSVCDPGDISKTINSLKLADVQCSVIGLAAQLKICQTLTSSTKGQYNVILDESHFSALLNQIVVPPATSANVESSLVRMGFPHQLSSDARKPSLCMCHLETSAGGAEKNRSVISTAGYLCPQCHSRYCELPVECKTCGLTLVSAPHLARSYHHLFPVPIFEEANPSENQICEGCQSLLTSDVVYMCPTCSNVFCPACDIFIHDTLHTCPGCASTRDKQTAAMTSSHSNINS